MRGESWWHEAVHRIITIALLVFIFVCCIIILITLRAGAEIRRSQWANFFRMDCKEKDTAEREDNTDTSRYCMRAFVRTAADSVCRNIGGGSHYFPQLSLF